MRELVGFWASVLVLGALVACAGNTHTGQCDIDGSGESNELDFVAFQSAFGSKRGDADWNPRADLDGSKTVTQLDFAIYQQKCEGK
jgi:hypothetical protein